LTPKIIKFNKKQVTWKITLGLFIFVILAAISNYIIYIAIQKKEFDSALLNVAGMQRMLTQKYTREVNIALVGLAASDWKKLLLYKMESSATEKKFEQHHQAFMNSGAVMIDNHELLIPAISEPQIRNKLQETDTAWQELKHAVLIAFRSKQTEIKGNDNLLYIQLQSMHVVELMDQAVTLMQLKSEQRLRKVESYLLFILFGFILTLLAGMPMPESLILP